MYFLFLFDKVLLRIWKPCALNIQVPKLVMPVSTCVVRTPSFCLARGLNVCVVTSLVRLLYPTSHRINHPTWMIHPPSRSTTHPMSARTLTCQGRVLQPFSAAPTNAPSTNVLALAPTQHGYCYSSRVEPRGECGVSEQVPWLRPGGAWPWADEGRTAR